MPTHIDASFDRDGLWDEIVADSEARLADPLGFVEEVLERLFLHEHDDERGLGRWHDAMDNGIWWADDALACLDKVLSDPPPDLGARIRAHAAPVLGDGVIATDEARVAWLRAMVERMRAAFEVKIAELREALRTAPAEAD